MTAKLTAPLRAAPATVPALVLVALFGFWASDQAGYPLTHWAPVALVALALLCLTAWVLRPRIGDLARPAQVALACLAAYTAFSYLSIAWADAPGDAWEGANRTLMYLLLFALFAAFRPRGASAVLLLVVWLLVMVGLAAAVLVHLGADTSARLADEFSGGRLSYPTGYPNANAAQWLIAFWPAVLLARSERLHWLLRGVLAGGAVLLAGVALLSQSRGSFYATPVMLVLVFALIPGRLRTFALLVPIAGAVAVAAPAILHVGDNAVHGLVSAHDLGRAIAAIGLAAAAVAAIVAAGSLLEARARLPAAAQARVRTAVAVAAGVALVGVVAAGLAAAGDPVHRVESAWHSFKGGYGSNSSSGSRLVSGLGSNRYDFYRVALDQFVDHPVGGIGADNYQQQYLVHGRSDETPRYPHSVELRTLTQTGVIGALLALVGLGALLAGRGALRSEDPLARVAAAAALAGFAYWCVHGSFDWFFEFAGLGGPAFALAGIVCGLAPARRRASAQPASAAAPPGVSDGAPAEASDGTPAQASDGASPARRLEAFAAPVAAGVVALAAAYSLTAPWLSQLQLQSAARIWTHAPAAAYSRLQDAADLNPLSERAYVLAGSIALRYGELARADASFARALQRTPNDAYATLERGAIASQRGDSAAARALLARAVALDPRDPLARGALAVVQRGGRVSVEALNRQILLKARQLA